MGLEGELSIERERDGTNPIDHLQALDNDRSDKCPLWNPNWPRKIRTGGTKTASGPQWFQPTGGTGWNSKKKNSSEEQVALNPKHDLSSAGDVTRLST